MVNPTCLYLISFRLTIDCEAGLMLHIGPQPFSIRNVSLGPGRELTPIFQAVEVILEYPRFGARRGILPIRFIISQAK